jgi:hypothetical protein
MRQSSFAAALLLPNTVMPSGLTDPQGRPCPARFDVYRNNVAASLTKVLQAAFPVVEKLVGAEFFQAMAVEFLRIHPPKTRLMMLYGEEFSAFLAGFSPVAHLPYLPDVARLEQAIRESYHSADTVPIAADALARLSPEDFFGIRLTLAPSLRLIGSKWPILSIWTVNREGGILRQTQPEDVVVLRADYDPKPLALPQGGGPILAALMAGQTVGKAVEAADSSADFVGLLTLLLTHNAIQDIT